MSDSCPTGTNSNFPKLVFKPEMALKDMKIVLSGYLA